MVELVDALDSKSSTERCDSSSLSGGTINLYLNLMFRAVASRARYSLTAPIGRGRTRIKPALSIAGFTIGLIDWVLARSKIWDIMNSFARSLLLNITKNLPNLAQKHKRLETNVSSLLNYMPIISENDAFQ